MRRTVILSILVFVLALSMPVLVRSASGIQKKDGSNVQKKDSSTQQMDMQERFTVLLDGKHEEFTMADYLPHVLSAEMPASFEAEALRAQAVAARTYIYYQKEHPKTAHPGADVCTDPNCCKAYISETDLKERWGASYNENWEKMCSAVQHTDGVYVTYEDKPIQAVFHSSSPGKTEASGNLWMPVPYLISVNSPENAQEVPEFVTTVEVTPENFRQTILSGYPNVVFAEAPETWLAAQNQYDSGRTAFVEVAGVSISGNEMRLMFGLRSTAFTLEYTGDIFVFTVSGYGHGVGMSQYGANIMAKNGSSYIEILNHYYPGTKIQSSNT